MSVEPFTQTMAHAGSTQISSIARDAATAISGLNQFSTLNLNGLTPADYSISSLTNPATFTKLSQSAQSLYAGFQDFLSLSSTAQFGNSLTNISTAFDRSSYLQAANGLTSTYAQAAKGVANATGFNLGTVVAEVATAAVFAAARTAPAAQAAQADAQAKTDREDAEKQEAGAKAAQAESEKALAAAEDARRRAMREAEIAGNYRRPGVLDTVPSAKQVRYNLS